MLSTASGRPRTRAWVRNKKRFVFLALPAEIRNTIYRLLLCDHEPISSLWKPRDKRRILFPSILRTCRQVLSETQPILYGENIFSMKIFHRFLEGPRAYFLKCDHFGLEAEGCVQHMLRYLRRLDIVVELQDEEETRSVKSAVTAVCKVLSGLPQLDHLHVTLDGRGYNAQSHSRVLSGFALLRNVQNVILDGVPKVYGKYLKSKMTGNSPLDHLPKMYDALLYFAGHFDCCEKELQEATNAIEDDDVKCFKSVRAEIVILVSNRMKDATDRLYDHDANKPVLGE